jgi:hypothetical protein
VPRSTDADAGVIATPITGTMLIGNETIFVGSDSGVATIFTVAGDGGIAGAVYTPLCVMVPHTCAVQPLPATLHETVRSGFEFAAAEIVAAYVAEAPASTVAGPLMEMENVLLRFTATAAVLDESATLTAVSVTEGGAGSICGAV